VAAPIVKAKVVDVVEDPVSTYTEKWSNEIMPSMLRNA
jgi:hypothetical protein